VFSHWSASWPALLGYAVVALAHLAGLVRLSSPGDETEQRDRRRHALLFQGGLLLALLSLVSPIGYWSDVYIWVRAVQLLLLGLVAPGLMVLGAPWLALRAGLLWRTETKPRADDADRGPDRQPWLLARPGLAVIAANVVLLGWQLPVAFDAVKTSSAVALACHASYLAAGLVLWLQVIGSYPYSPLSTPLRALRLVVGTVVATTVVGGALVFGSGVVYPVYANSHHLVMTVLDDQQLAGAVIWMGSLPPLIAAGVALLLHWLNHEESAELSAELDRLITPRKDAWSARPGIR
jgi:cytochrome c oxidase assembly factor CtaG